jgi:hypothetical protein
MNEQNDLRGVQGEIFSSLETFWLQAGKDAIKGAIDKQEEAAKQIISITSILQALYFAAISFSDLKKSLFQQNLQDIQLFALVILFISPIVIWLISLRFSISVLVPITRHTDLNSPYDIREMYRAAIDHKARQLRRAHLALVLGFLPLIFNMIIYLIWIQVLPIQGK